MYTQQTNWVEDYLFSVTHILRIITNLSLYIIDGKKAILRSEKHIQTMNEGTRRRKSQRGLDLNWMMSTLQKEESL